MRESCALLEDGELEDGEVSSGDLIDDIVLSAARDPLMDVVPGHTASRLGVQVLTRRVSFS